MHFAFWPRSAQELGLKQLSMGMSADFETAVAFGATHVRSARRFSATAHSATRVGWAERRRRTNTNCL